MSERLVYVEDIAERLVGKTISAITDREDDRRHDGYTLTLAFSDGSSMAIDYRTCDHDDPFTYNP